PTDDLEHVFNHVLFRTDKATKAKTTLTDFDIKAIANNLKRGIDILEGNPVPNRMYSGLPLLHFAAAEKGKDVEPIRDQNGNVIGGNVNIHQVWYDTHIESDTALISVKDVVNVPWTITYTIDVLKRGNDDFSPFVMYTDDPAIMKPPMPHVAMD